MNAEQGDDVLTTDLHRESPATRELSTAQASTDAQLVELWLHGRGEHTRRAYRSDVERLTRLTRHARKPLRSLTLGDLQAFAEIGKAVKTIFLCEYLRSGALRREIHEGLNVVENWNSANSFICFGKGGELATNRLEEQELAMLCLHLLQICLVYVNTLMIQQVLGEQSWRDRMTAEDLRALTPLIYAHVNPYGIFRLDLSERLVLDRGYAASFTYRTQGCP